MLARYASAIRRIDEETEMMFRRYMAEHGTILHGDDLYESLSDALLCQADLVLGMLRLNTRRSLRCAELLVGRPITHCPPMLALCYAPPRLASERRRSADERRRSADERRVVNLQPPQQIEKGRRRLLCSGLYARLALVKVGMSVRHALLRGLKRRDLRLALRRGYVQLEAA